MTAIEGPGTTEQEWLPFLAGLDLPALPLQPPPTRAVVVAPHPDDEVLGVGGLLALLQAAGTRVEVVAVTDGGASHPGGSLSPDELVPLRRAETRSALRALGLPGGVTALGLPDGGAGALEEPVSEALRLQPDDWLLAPWEHDGHPDHEAVGRGCATAAQRDGARLLAYPVWAWHWDRPGGALPWARAHRVDLPADVRAVKDAAVQLFATQVRPIGPRPQDAPVLPPAVLARFARDVEVVLA